MCPGLGSTSFEVTRFASDGTKSPVIASRALALIFVKTHVATGGHSLLKPFASDAC